MKRRFINLTLANGHTRVIIDKQHIAMAMRLKVTDEDTGRMEVFTRIIPRDIVINPESNWLDVMETPEQIARMI